VAQASTQSAEILRAYAPRLLTRWLAEQPHLSFRTLEGSMVFVDISGFTKMSERLARHGKVGAEEVTEVLGAVFAKLLAVAYGEDGSLLKFGGDALLLWFSGNGHAVRAATAAHGMRGTLRSVGRLDTTAGKVVLRMSVGVNSGTFHFFLVGESHREFMVTGPAASRTVDMESTATAGEILLSRDTAAALPSNVLGQPKGEGILLRSGPTTLPFERDDEEVPITSIDIAQAIPVALREHLLSGATEPEHRNATVAFVHFDGTDELVETHGVDVVAAGLHELVACVQRAAEDNGVTFLATDIDHDGGKVILVAGAPNAMGDDEGRMLLTLRSIIDAETTVPVRIGVNKGHVFAGDIGPAYRRTYTVMGDAVNLAARVMSMAVPGQILATGPVLDASSIAFNAVALEPFMVKGKKDPVHAFMVGHSTGSKPEIVSREFPLVGRDAEMDAFRRALLELRGGRGSALELVGNAGMGKTRLLSEFRAEAPDLPHLVSGCELYESSVSYLPIRRLLRLLLGTGAGEDASALARRLRDDMSQRAPDLLPWLPLIGIVADLDVPMTPEVGDLGDEFRKAKLEEVTTEYLSRVVTEPTLVVIEDVHWMDGGSADLLRSVAQRIRDLPWLICVSRRDEESGFVLPEAPRCTSLGLTPLAGEALESLIDIAMKDAPLHMHEVTELSDRSGGNPLFLQELLHATRSAGSVEGLPGSIEGMITADIDRLATPDRRVLRYASVLGMSFDRSLLGALLEGEDAAFERYPWERLAQFVDDEGGGSYRFRHALMRDAAYEGLPFRRRRELHARVGGALLALPGDAEQAQSELLSLHFFLAGEFERAWRYSRIAAERAKSAYANIEAARFFRRASDAGRRAHEVNDHEIATVEESLGDALNLAGDFKKAAEAFAAARKLIPDDRAAIARLLYKRSRIEESLGRYPQALRWASRGRKVLDGLDDVDATSMRAQLGAWYATVLYAQGRGSDSIHWGQKAIQEAMAAGDQNALARAYNAIGLSSVLLGRSPGDYWPKALEIYEEREDLVGQVVILSNLGFGGFYAGTWDEALEFYERGRQLSVRIGDVVSEMLLADNIAEIYCERGQFDEAEANLRRSLRFWKASQYRFFLGACLRFLGRVLARTGRFEEALDAFDEARGQFVHAGALEEVLSTDVRIAECRVFMGESAEALRVIAEAEERKDVEEEAASLSKPLLERVRGFALVQMGDLSQARTAFDASLESARSRNDDFEVALTLHAMVWLDRLEGREPPIVLEDEASSILKRLRVESVAEIPLPAASR
jgi:class 3 adenylate cyclase/tetratricopeptide (TPR) repeat protein